MINFSLLGYGHIGKVHLQAIKDTANAQLVSIIDVNQPAEIDTKYYPSLDQFLAQDDETDVVVIATPNGLHKQHAIQCLQAGKNVLIEKPIALSLDDAKEIIEVEHQTQKRVFSSMQLRFSPPVQFIKNLIQNQELGQIYMVNIQCYWNRNHHYYTLREWHGTNHMDGGVLYTQFSHFIDIINYWFDEVRCENAQYFNFNHQGVTEFADSGKVDFWADGAVGNMIFTTSTFEKNFESSITIIAEKGTVKLGDQYLNELKFCNLTTEVDLAEHSTEIKNFHPRAIAEICEAITQNRASILDGIHALKLVEFIENSYQLAH